MCSNPQTIPNPAYKHGVTEHFRHTDDVSPTLVVPCGVCDQCASLKSIYLAQRLEMESKLYWIFFFTFTCKDEYLIREDLDGVVLARYPIDVLTKAFKRFRKLFNVPDNPLYGRKMKYYYITEYGTSFHRPHVHGFLLISKERDFVKPFVLEHYLFKWWKSNLAVNRGSLKIPILESIFDYHQKYIAGKLVRNFDFRYIDVRSVDNFGPLYYINKYLFKSDKYVQYMWNIVHQYHGFPQKHTDDYSEFQKHWNLYRPRVRKSLLFGFPTNYVDLDMVNYFGTESLKRGMEYPCFISPINNTTKPLSPFYKQYMSPRILDRFRFQEYTDKGFITQKVLENHPKCKISPNKFDFTDLF